MNGREMFRQMTNDKQTSKHKLGNRTDRWSKVQADARCPNSKKAAKAATVTTPKTTSIKKRLTIQPKAKFRRRTSHEANRMQMSKILCSPHLHSIRLM